MNGSHLLLRMVFADDQAKDSDCGTLPEFALGVTERPLQRAHLSLLAHSKSAFRASGGTFTYLFLHVTTVFQGVSLDAERLLPGLHSQRKEFRSYHEKTSVDALALN